MTKDTVAPSTPDGVTPQEILGTELHQQLLAQFDASPQGIARKAYEEAFDKAKAEQDAAAAQAEQDSDTETGDARTRANRENAKKSTGPRSESGKAASSRNASRHGLFVADLSKFLSLDELGRYENFITGIVSDLRPVGTLELVLARRAADIQFRLELLRTAELHAYSGHSTLASSMAAKIDQHRDPLALVSLYDSRFSRAFKCAMDELRQVQKARRDEQQSALSELKNITAAHLQQGATFDPTKFGFVISRDLVFQKAHLQKVQTIACGPLGDGRVAKMVVDAAANVPEKAA
jgi:hypothetical protein